MAIPEVLMWNFQLWRCGQALWRGAVHSCFDVANTNSHCARHCALTQKNTTQPWPRQSPALMMPKGWLAEGRHLETGEEFQVAETGRQDITEHTGVPGSLCRGRQCPEEWQERRRRQGAADTEPLKGQATESTLYSAQPHSSKWLSAYYTSHTHQWCTQIHFVFL